MTATFLSPIESPQGLVKKLAYYFTRKQFGRVPTPIKVHSARLPAAFGLTSSGPRLPCRGDAQASGRTTGERPEPCWSIQTTGEDRCAEDDGQDHNRCDGYGAAGRGGNLASVILAGI
jgi:hypothetical protein